MPTLTDRTLSVGLLHAAASELLIRRAMALHQQGGMKLRHEAKQAFTRFLRTTSGYKGVTSACRK